MSANHILLIILSLNQIICDTRVQCGEGGEIRFGEADEEKRSFIKLSCLVTAPGAEIIHRIIIPTKTLLKSEK